LTVILNGKESSASSDGPPAPTNLAPCRRPRNCEQPHTSGKRGLAARRRWPRPERAHRGHHPADAILTGPQGNAVELRSQARSQACPATTLSLRIYFLLRSAIGIRNAICEEQSPAVTDGNHYAVEVSGLTDASDVGAGCNAKTDLRHHLEEFEEVGPEKRERRRPSPSPRKSGTRHESLTPHRVETPPRHDSFISVEVVD
jgi:hypothetical protein